jgi:site-specific DNA recombinase
VHDGEHAGIIDPVLWQRVQATLQRNGRTGGALVRNKFGALLKGLLHCVPCSCAMTPAHTTRNGNKRYRYYTCVAAQKRGWNTCPSKSIPAGEIERYVINCIRVIYQDPTLLNDTLAAAHAEANARLDELRAERRNLVRQLGQWNAEVLNLLAEAGTNGGQSPALAQFADRHERIRADERRLAEIDEQMAALSSQRVDEDDVAQALSSFDPLWQSLAPREQARIVQLLVERVDYDGGQNTVAITFHPSGIKALADELAGRRQENCA